jgi:hypothetical protein
MKPARIALFLQLCLVAGIAAATPEQEMQAEAQKLLPTLFSKCGEDYYSKRMFKHKQGMAYVIGQYRGLSTRTTRQTVHSRNAAKGVEWKGNIQFTANTSREFTHGMYASKGQRNPPELDIWSKWKLPNLVVCHSGLDT